MRPNRHTLGLIAVLVAMGYAGLSRNNAAAYLLGFLTFSLGAVSLVHTWANLRGLRVTIEPINPFYEEEPIAVQLSARAEAGRRHVGVQLHVAGGNMLVFFATVDDEHTAREEMLLPPRTRGRYHAIELVATSLYPLGFFTAQRRLRLEQEFYVYPKPEGSRPLPIEPQTVQQAQSGARADGDDFAGVSEWHPGESMRHVDWKAVARGQRLMVKQWSGTATDPLTLDYDALPSLGPEARVRQLARWVILATRHEAPYRLKLPGSATALGTGDAHFHHCMRLLAEFRA